MPIAVLIIHRGNYEKHKLNIQTAPELAHITQTSPELAHTAQTAPEMAQKSQWLEELLLHYLDTIKY
jgi:hypothetical protein